MRFVVTERLRWGNGALEHLQPRGRPFEYAGECICFYNSYVETGSAEMEQAGFCEGCESTPTG